jgi:hypothetical protein
MSDTTKKNRNRNLQTFAADQDLNKGNLIRCRGSRGSQSVGRPRGPFWFSGGGASCSYEGHTYIERNMVAR